MALVSTHSTAGRTSWSLGIPLPWWFVIQQRLQRDYRRIERRKEEFFEPPSKNATQETCLDKTVREIRERERERRIIWYVTYMFFWVIQDGAISSSWPRTESFSATGGAAAAASRARCLSGARLLKTGEKCRQKIFKQGRKPQKQNPARCLSPPPPPPPDNLIEWNFPLDTDSMSCGGQTT